MANFARLENGFISDVIAVDNENCGGGDFPNSEPIGQQFISHIGIQGEFLQTSYNNNFRGVCAQRGYTYDLDLDVFVAPPQPTERPDNV